jgi:hypothetical protein
MIEPRRLSGQHAKKLFKSRFKTFQKKQKNHNIPQMGDVFYSILCAKYVLRRTGHGLQACFLENFFLFQIPAGLFSGSSANFG